MITPNPGVSELRITLEKIWAKKEIGKNSSFPIGKNCYGRVKHKKSKTKKSQNKLISKRFSSILVTFKSPQLWYENKKPVSFIFFQRKNQKKPLLSFFFPFLLSSSFFLPLSFFLFFFFQKELQYKMPNSTFILIFQKNFLVALNLHLSESNKEYTSK